VGEGFHELIFEDGVSHVFLPDGGQIMFDAVAAYNFTPRHPREAGRRASVSEELIRSAHDHHPMAFFAGCRKPDTRFDGLPEAEVRAMLQAVQARMQAQDPGHPWGDVSGLSVGKARQLLARVIDLEEGSNVHDAPTWSTAWAAQAARKALEPRRGHR
jgi:hypothetical protein